MKSYDVSLMYGTIANGLHITRIEVYTTASANHEKELRYETFAKVFHDGQNPECFVYDAGLPAFIQSYLITEEDEHLYSALPTLSWCESGMSSEEHYHLIFGVW